MQHTSKNVMPMLAYLLMCPFILPGIEEAKSIELKKLGMTFKRIELKDKSIYVLETEVTNKMFYDFLKEKS